LTGSGDSQAREEQSPSEFANRLIGKANAAIHNPIYSEPVKAKCRKVLEEAGGEEYEKGVGQGGVMARDADGEDEESEGGDEGEMVRCLHFVCSLDNDDKEVAFRQLLANIDFSFCALPLLQNSRSTPTTTSATWMRSTPSPLLQSRSR
jgi:hypothetical protein